MYTHIYSHSLRDQYDECTKPIPVWLVVSYLTVMFWQCHKFMEQHWLYHPGV
jgi:hypothetical protein